MLIFWLSDANYLLIKVFALWFASNDSFTMLHGRFQVMYCFFLLTDSYFLVRSVWLYFIIRSVQYAIPFSILFICNNLWDMVNSTDRTPHSNMCVCVRVCTHARVHVSVCACMCVCQFFFFFLTFVWECMSITIFNSV